MLTITKMTAILPHWLVKSFCRNFSLSSIKNKKNFSAKYSSKFGIIFDIDGVLLRGSTVISAAKEAFQLLVNSESNKFVIPCVFCTNAFGLPNTKAAALSKCLDVEVSILQFFCKVLHAGSMIACCISAFLVVCINEINGILKARVFSIK